MNYLDKIFRTNNFRLLCLIVSAFSIFAVYINYLHRDYTNIVIFGIAGIIWLNLFRINRPLTKEEKLKKLGEEVKNG